jgi:hypothetical protein
MQREAKRPSLLSFCLALLLDEFFAISARREINM